MPTTPPVNTQQVLQIGTHTEKLQQTFKWVLAFFFSFFLPKVME